MIDDESYKKCRREVSDYISDWFDKQSSEAAVIHKNYERLMRIAGESMQDGGKYLRPYLVWLGYKYGDKTTSIVPVAAAFELLHYAFLIHDDIIDGDVRRRGKLNITGRYIEVYQSITSQAKRKHFAESVALLAGDICIAGSISMVLDSAFDPGQQQKALRHLLASMYEVGGGELLDVEASMGLEDKAPPETIYRYKTAGYSMVHPLLVGAELAGCSNDIRRTLESFGIELGIAFQLSDDILGVFGDEKLTGKSTLSDLREGKYSYLIAQFERHANPAQRKKFYTHFGQSNLSEREASLLRTILDDCGAKQAAVHAVDEYTERANQLLALLPRGEASQALQELITVLKRRCA
ncbi:polyprenyl synthetase family protein [Candidatus Saccharibacteria bacterium]|nr:MAG: polyprenyl synthetase family protein [Candidatus Saccharibacteria bacterium]